MISKNFIIPSTAKSLVEEDALYITGVANTGLEDLVGDIVTQEALEQICTQITNHNLHMDHDTTIVDGVLGPLVDGWIEEDGVHYKARILSEKRELIESLLSQGVNLGSSISGVCNYEEGSNSNITEWALTEISLTAIPCDQGTMATVQIAKSLAEVVQAVRSNIHKEVEGENMEENKEITKEVEEQNEDVLTIEKVEELINTAFNEKQEDLIESVRNELKNEYEAVLNELKERIETLESQAEETTTEEETTTTPSEGEGEGEGESKATTDEEEEEEGEKPEEEEEEEEKSLEDMVEKAVQTALQKAFNPQATPQFQYDKEKSEEESTKKGYTPRELAEMLS